MKTLVLTASAARGLDALPADARSQVSDGLDQYGMTGKGDVKRLSGQDGFRAAG